jgi:predicted nucleotidyltransferase
MEIEVKNNEITLNKEINDLDKFVIEFVNVLDELKIRYVLIAGYISILFGRARGTDDIDIFIEPLDMIKFDELFRSLDKNNFWCINTDDVDDALEYLTTKNAIRVAKKPIYVPNMEIKFAKEDLDFEILDENIKVKVNGNKLIISPIELQIIFKRTKLGSPKDLEDAMYLEEIFKDKLNQNKIDYYKRAMKNV